MLCANSYLVDGNSADSGIKDQTEHAKVFTHQLFRDYDTSLRSELHENGRGGV